MAYPDESCWPYEPNARKSTKRVDWFSIPDESFLRATPARIRSLDEADARKLYTDDRLGHRREQLPQDARDALDMMMTGAVSAAPTKVNKAELRGRLESELETVKSQAEADGNVSGQLQAIKLHAELLALLNEKEAKIDPIVNIFVNTGVPRNG
jgi:hypothetical protein